jgi:Glycerophosphoryl diester phosphodiesterase family
MTTSVWARMLSFLVACRYYASGGCCVPEVLAMNGKILSRIGIPMEGAEMRTKGSRIKFLSTVCVVMLCLSRFGGIAAAGDEPDNDRDNQRSKAEDFLRLEVRPIAIGHHGVGPNSGANPNPALPIENTVDSVRQAYSLGARVVEVDVQLTQHGRLAVFHDDFLSDFTCIHALTLDQLQ